jgi:hypothetical protein
MAVRLDDIPRELLVAFAVAAFVWAIALAARGWLRRLRMRRRFIRGGEGEREAAALLEANGFVIEGVQVGATYDVRVDDEVVPVSVRADYVVSRAGRHWVAEVKTGRMATRIDTPATRRQLLEYEHAFGVDGVLLVDADARTIRSIGFAAKPRRGNTTLAFAFALAAVVVAYRVLVNAR